MVARCEQAGYAALAAPAPRELQLAGGRRVLLRAIEARDGEALQGFVAALSLDSRHKRFHVGLPRLSATVLRQLVEVDQRRHVAVVAQPLLTGDGRHVAPQLVADARYVRDEDRPGEAEFAIAVADDWQSLGLGRALMARMAADAHARGLKALYGDMLVENRRMIVLMRGLGARTELHPDGPQLLRAVFDLR